MGNLEHPGNLIPENHILMKSKLQKFSYYFYLFTYIRVNSRLQIHQWSEETIRKVVRDNWSVRGGTVKKVTDVMVTPRVVEEIRNHFNCPELEGAELEDQGGDGTALTHWEKRILEVIKCF